MYCVFLWNGKRKPKRHHINLSLHIHMKIWFGWFLGLLQSQLFISTRMKAKQYIRVVAEVMCVNFFSMIQYVNQNPTMKQCIDGASRVAGWNNFGGGSMFSFQSKANAGRAADYIAPINRQKKK
mmetsp:Transcript_33560/g.57029  ORF Transcript_33560/g.57029 Transcript_33560/m.57029 type:complete len:124 (+) Transcript_33560:1138-1509(+)